MCEVSDEVRDCCQILPLRFPLRLVLACALLISRVFLGTLEQIFEPLMRWTEIESKQTLHTPFS